MLATVELDDCELLDKLDELQLLELVELHDALVRSELSDVDVTPMLELHELPQLSLVLDRVLLVVLATVELDDGELLELLETLVVDRLELLELVELHDALVRSLLSDVEL